MLGQLGIVLAIKRWTNTGCPFQPVVTGTGPHTVPLMNDPPLQPGPDDYLLLPSVTHPGGCERAFNDAYKAMVRFMIEVNDNPTMAYAIDKTDRIVTEANTKLLSEDDLAEWEAACEEFESMSDDEHKRWVEQVLACYPAIEGLPDLGSYNDIN